MRTPEVRLACARPGDIADADSAALEALLDPLERETAQRFQHELDRKAYVVAHALRRALIAHETHLPAPAVRIAHDSRGKPFLAAPGGDAIHFSHTRNRNAVACAVTRASPVGIDVEYVDERRADVQLLGPFVALSAQAGTEAVDFFRHWTALEAFWKACGTGLADGNPRIRCAMQAGHRFDISFESGEADCVARGLSIDAFNDCALTLVLRAPVHREFAVRRVHCCSAVEILHLSNEKAPNENFDAPNIQT